VALLVAFVVREATARNPLMPLRIFRSRNVSGANAVQALSVAGMFGTFFLGSLYMERVLGYTPLQIGLAFLPTTLVMGTISLRFSETLVTRFGPKATLIAGLVPIAAAQLLFSRAPVDGSYVVDIVPMSVLLGLGAGMAFPALMNLGMSGATPQDAGLASGLVNTTVQVGGALGLAVLATLSTTRTDSLVSSGHSTAVALTGGYHLAFLIGFALVVAAIVVAFAVLRSPAPAQAPGLEPAYDAA
jgi:MFS family permease